MLHLPLQLTTGQGRGRALIRQCLGEHLLADCVQNSISNTKRTKYVIHVCSSAGGGEGEGEGGGEEADQCFDYGIAFEALWSRVSDSVGVHTCCVDVSWYLYASMQSV